MTTQLTQLGKKSKQYLALGTEEKLTWCTGCGNFGIQNALMRALTLENLGLQNALLCFDIGCNGNGADKIHAYTLHGLHGRVISAAAGAVIANPKLKVIAMAGDGATFSEGVNHLVHAVRNNYPMLFILHNNENYGLTTGQASSTTRKGCRMNGTVEGVTTEPLNPLQMILSLKPTFVARSFSGNVNHMTDMIRAGLNHNGFAVVEIMQVCPTYNKSTSNEWFWERIKYVDDIKNYDRHDIWAARKAADDLEKEINMGVLYENRDEPNFMERLASREGVKTTLVEEVKAVDVGKLMTQFE
jgi:2-oxoglutarate ferredoxin oxidoreductase subunit beta